jgi:crotonobetainyl-CoA:carnitine CoA-transferase CaiB-like acyl-CoA transferase
MTSSGKQMLDGIRVLDIGNLLAGPGISTNLADFGADVIKVEHPKGGDPSRNWGAKKNGIPLAWKAQSRGKRLLALDINHPEGQEIIRKLAAKSDVMIENYRPGKLEEWGLSYDKLSERNPKLILVRVSGWGQTGPYKNRPGFGTLAEAISGFAHITGQPDGPPTLPPFGLADGITAQIGTWVVMMALYYRDVRQQPGQVIELSIYESIFSILGPQPMEYDQLGIVPGRAGNRSPRGVPRNAYKTADGRWVAISANSPNIALRLFKAMGREDMTTDPRYSTASARLKHGDEVDGLVADWIARRSLEDVLSILEKFEVAIAPVYDIQQIMKDPHFQARGTIIQIPDEELGKIRMPNIVPRLSRTPGHIRYSGKTQMGCDSVDILREIGMSAEEIAGLLKEGVIASKA